MAHGATLASIHTVACLCVYIKKKRMYTIHHCASIDTLYDISCLHMFTFCLHSVCMFPFVILELFLPSDFRLKSFVSSCLYLLKKMFHLLKWFVSRTLSTPPTARATILARRCVPTGTAAPDASEHRASCDVRWLCGEWAMKMMGLCWLRFWLI